MLYIVSPVKPINYGSMSLVSTVQQLTGSFYALLPGGLGSNVKSSATSLPLETTTLFVRADSITPQTLVNVYGKNGNKVYTIERQKGLRNARWYVYTQPDRHEVAILTIGLLGRSIQRGAVTTNLEVGSGILQKLHRYYRDSNGHLYSWSRRSLLLERISNPGGGYGEHRDRVAQARLARAGHFDWELAVDTERADLIDTLASAFITMKTQWLSNSLYEKPGSFATGPADGAEEASDSIPKVSPDLLVYSPDAASPKPRNFFNPPKFLEHKFTRKPH